MSKMRKEQILALLMEGRTPIVEKCKGCKRIDSSAPDFCGAYLYPDKKWRLGSCNAATHLRPIIDETKSKTRVGQQKQKKKVAQKITSR